MSGKAKCKILKEIRQKIADSNDIPLVVSECRYQGNCKGTCPKCEAELRYLEEELRKRKALGKAIVITGLVATIAVGYVGYTQVLPELLDSISEGMGIVGPNFDDFN